MSPSNRARRPTWAGLVGSVSVAALLVSGSAGPALARQQPQVTVALSPPTVTDGQTVTITIRTAPGVKVDEARIQQCRGGVDYRPSASRFVPDDFLPASGNCPSSAVSSSADQLVTAPGLSLTGTGTPEGETMLFRVGRGVVEWTTEPGKPKASLTCDIGSDCVLLVEIQTGATADSLAWQPFPLPLMFGVDDPLAGCGGPAPGALATGGSDRFSDAYVAWTVGECTQPGRTGAASRATFVGEGDAVESLAAGTLDLAYTGGGYDEAMGLVAADGALAGVGLRAAVPVPAGLNAAVLAVGGGLVVGGHKVPFRDIKLTVDEVAALLNLGTTGLDPYLPAIRERNPELAQAGIYDTSATELEGKAAAFAGAEASSWYLTRWLTAAASPDAWTVPDIPVFGTDRGKPRRADVSLALADPKFTNTVLKTGRPAMGKALLGPNGGSSGAVWVYTDLVTARALGLTPVQIENAAGRFVAPTAETLAAAVPTMTRDAQGILISDAAAVAAEGAVQPYPLTFVEYALAPAEPLLDTDCSARPQSQALLAGWLRYITGPGQERLPAGMAPLTEDLRTEAAGAMAEVGGSAVTGDCKDRVASTETSSTTTSVPVPAPTSGATGGTAAPSTERSSTATGPSGSTGPASGAGGTTVDTATVALATTSKSPPEKPAIPAYGGKAATAFGGVVIALLGMIGVSSLPAFGPPDGGPWWRRRRRGRGSGPVVGSG